MTKLLVLLLVVVACRPDQRVENPHKKQVGSAREVIVTEAPASAVQTREGQQVELASLWKDQKIILVFYRGGWCPHCTKQLTQINESQGKFAQAGAKVIAISADSGADATATKDKLALTFDVYVDPDLKTISQWGVEDHDNNIARPATFVIQPGGQVTFRKVGENPADWATIDELLAAVSG
ncbi:MAG: peroxiredoxin-like family protein [Kofleriaceae bacterium]